MNVRRALIVTNRPAIANSWYDDFQRFIGHRTTYHFVSESPSQGKVTTGQYVEMPVCRHPRPMRTGT